MEQYRVIHVVRQFSPAIGGLESFVKSLALQQIATGLEVEVVTLNKVFHQKNEQALECREVIDGITVTRVSYRGSHKYPLAFNALQKIKGADLVHVHAVDFFADYLSLSQLVHKKPLVLSTHGGFFHTNNTSIVKKLFFNVITRFTIKNYAAVAACSNGDFYLFEKIRKKNLHLVENGVDLHKFFSTHVKQASKRLVFIGRFSKNKRIDILLQFFCRLVEIDRQYQLLIIGKDWDNSLDNINYIISKLDLSNNVTVLCGLSDDNIKNYVNISCFIVSASEYEGFGLSIIEGMSAGLIPICSKIPSFTKIVNESKVGLNIDFYDPEQVYAVNQFIEGQLHNFTENSLKVRQASEKYGWELKAREFKNIYDEVLGLHYRKIQGVEIDTRTGNEVVTFLDNQIKNRQQTLVAFANAHTINTAQNDAEYKSILNSFLVLNDGIGVEIASKLKYQKGFEENLNGTDFVPRYLSTSNETLKIFLLGATESVVSEAFAIWATKYQSHEWCGFHNGYFNQHDSLQIIDLVKKSGANTLIVAMGNPIQEKWLSQYKDQLPIDLAFGVGALFDFVAGRVRRAPRIVQKLKLEWAFRLVQEPKRLWRRYIIGNAVFIFNCLKD